jgi:hypothetical protein
VKFIRCYFYASVQPPADPAKFVWLNSAAIRTAHFMVDGAGRGFVSIVTTNGTAFGIVPTNGAAWTPDPAGQYITAVWWDQTTKAVGLVG